MDRIDTDKIKTALDLRDVAAQHTTLRPWAAGELAGPCPKCGGTDRFHVKADWFYCNQCWPYDNDQSHDAIGFMQWLDGCGFVEACHKLSNGDLPAASTRRQPDKPKPKACRSEAWQREARDTIKRAVAVLDSDAGKPGRDYLAGRSIQQDTWRAFGMGYDPAKWHTGWQRKAGAVVIPWVIGDKVAAIKYRFVEAEHKADRFRSTSGGEQSLFGLQNIGKHRDTLILCEGEFNAMSLWQAVRDLGRGDVDVVSFGSEGGAIHEQGLKLARKYRRVIVWADDANTAREAARTMGARGLKSPEGQDANDLLRACLLTEFVELALQRFGTDRARPWVAVTLILPGDTPLGLPAGKWHRLRSGEIKATYTRDELETALTVARAVTL